MDYVYYNPVNTDGCRGYAIGRIRAFIAWSTKVGTRKSGEACPHLIWLEWESEQPAMRFAYGSPHPTFTSNCC